MPFTPVLDSMRETYEEFQILAATSSTCQTFCFLFFYLLPSHKTAGRCGAFRGHRQHRHLRLWKKISVAVGPSAATAAALAAGSVVFQRSYRRLCQALALGSAIIDGYGDMWM